MTNSIQPSDKNTPKPSMHIVTAIIWTWVLIFFGIWMVLGPSRDQVTEWTPHNLEGYLIKLVWSRPAGILALLIALVIAWIATNDQEENGFRYLVYLGASSAFGAFVACIPARGQGFAIPVLQEAVIVALIAFFAVVLSRFTIFPIFTAISQLRSRGKQ